MQPCSCARMFKKPDKALLTGHRTGAPLVYGCDGHIFTNIERNDSNQVEIYQEKWMRRDSPACIGVKGDKGQIAQLLQKPVLIFDDKELNIELVRGHCTREVTMEGFLVQMGRKARRFIPEGFQTANVPQHWPRLLEEFADAQSSGDPNARNWQPPSPPYPPI